MDDLGRSPLMAPTDCRALETDYRGRSVLLTGHTGFKGGWLAVWLNALGAQVNGLALEPDTVPSFFEDAKVNEVCRGAFGDVRDLDTVRRVVRETRPAVIFHLAAQSLVRRSYEDPVATIATNVLGTVHLLEALRLERVRAAVVVVTSDKCYENREWVYGYRELDPMGGRDPYSASKGAAEIMVHCFRASYFPPERLVHHGVAVATARAGNVIGGGDWAKDRILPDAVRALTAGAPVPVRNPASIRPWSHVLEPLHGYLRLGAALLGPEAERFCEPWNFGPAPENACSVALLIEEFLDAWGAGSSIHTSAPASPPEAGILRLSIDKAITRLGWTPKWSLRQAIDRTAAWYRAWERGARGEELRALCLRQIAEFHADRQDA